jgi:hypothetical protein
MYHLEVVYLVKLSTGLEDQPLQYHSLRSGLETGLENGVDMA